METLNSKNKARIFTLAGSVILYNPDSDVFEHIKSYIDYLDCLFVVNNQNGDKIIEQLQKEYSNIQVINEPENMGIAYPLNQVLKLCKDKYDFLMTMDQDSCYVPGAMEAYVGQILNFDWHKTLGIGPKRIAYQEECPRGGDRIYWQPVRRLITSGNIINVKNALAIGGFNEELFIDEVDHEFCYRGLIHGLESYGCTCGIFLQHSIGNKITKEILGRTFSTMNHAPIRKYYIVRNRLMVYKQYHHMDARWFYREYILSTIKYIIKIIIGENQKLKKMKFCLLGILDFLNHKTGKFNN